MNSAYRALYIYDLLINQEKVRTTDLAQTFNVHQRTILRDLETIRDYIHDIDYGLNQSIIFNQNHKTYSLIKHSTEDNSGPLIDVCFEMTKDLHQQLHQIYPSQIIESNQHKVKVEMTLSAPTAINLCFDYRRDLRLISPDWLLAQLSTDIIRLLMIYFNQQL